jgi:hypothetical protein
MSKKGRSSSKENTSHLFNRYVWLVDVIYRTGGITFEEINDRWMQSQLNEDGEELPLRTFHNHRAAVQQMFDIDIECDKRNGYKYFIENSDDMERGGVRRWLLNTFAVNNLINESHKLKNRIQFEYIPSGQQYLTPIIEAMRDGIVLEVTYHPYWHDAFTMQLRPYFVKVFKQRWYVIGYNTYNDSVRIYALDRIEGLAATDERFTMPKDFEPEAYFANCYGIDHGDNPERVVLKMSAYQAKFARALPLHHSQKEEASGEGYSLFSYYMSPHTYDFKQAILSMMAEVEVLAPQSLRHEMQTIINDMATKYQPK